MADKYFSRFPQQLMGEDVDRGQVVELANVTVAGRVEQLTRLGYVQKLERGKVLATCGSCQKQFRTEEERDAHFKLRHKQTFEDDDALADAIEKEQNKAMQRSPLKLNKTAAALA